MSKKHKRVFEQIHRVATPGDVLFMTGHIKPDDLTLPWMLKRFISGYDTRDDSTWHTALYLGQTPSGNVEIAEAVVSGVRVQHLPSNYYTCGRRLEVARVNDKNLTDKAREQIVSSARAESGKRFDGRAIYGIPVERLLGLPNILAQKNAYTCQSFVLSVLERNGVILPGLSPNGIVDHDLYRHPKLEVLLSLEEGEASMIRVHEEPGKYSWSPALRSRYDLN